MFRRLGFTCVSLPPLVVFILEGLEVTVKTTVPVPVLAGIFPLGMLVMVAYSVSYKQAFSMEHYLEFARGAQTATFLVFFSSGVAAIFSVLVGEPLVGLSLALVSLGSILLPSVSAAGALGGSLSSANKTTLQGTKESGNLGLALLFLAFFLGAREYFAGKSREKSVIIYLWIFLILGWVFLSLSGGFPATLIGLGITVAAPISSYRIFVKSVHPNDRGRVKDILKGKQSSPR
jgi:hypothetical protein